MNELPSSAYTARSPICHATVVSNPASLVRGVSPVLSTTNAPVP
jgi:hypothetical protein